MYNAVQHIQKQAIDAALAFKNTIVVTLSMLYLLRGCVDEVVYR